MNIEWNNYTELGSKPLYFTKSYDDLERIFQNRYVPKIIAKLEYWFAKPEFRDSGFYKFTEPCQQPHYQTGDSWTEELRCTRKTFKSAFDLVGNSYKSKAAYLQSEDPFSGKLYCSYIDRVRKRTIYLRNNEKADMILGSMFGKRTPMPVEPLEKGDQDIDLYNRITKIFTKETRGEIALPYASSHLMKKIISAFKTFFQGSWEKLQAFCQKIFQNDFLMGRKSDGEFTPHMAFLFSQKVIESVFSGLQFPLRNGKNSRSIIQRETSLKITKAGRGVETTLKISEVETPSEESLEVSKIFEEMKTLFVTETEGKLATPHPTKRNQQLAFEAYKTTFQSDMNAVESYFRRVARSKFHMGEAANSAFKAQFSYLLRQEVIDDFHSGQITLDRTSKREEGARIESQRATQDMRDFKDQLSRNIRLIKDEYRGFVKETESNLKRDNHASQFQSYLEREAPYALEVWNEKGWNSTQIDVLFSFYVEETLMDVSLEEWTNKRLAQDCPDLISLMTDFKTSISQTHPHLLERFCGVDWEDVLLDSLFVSFLGQRKSQRDTSANSAQKICKSFGSQITGALKTLFADLSTDLSSGDGENMPLTAGIDKFVGN